MSQSVMTACLSCRYEGPYRGGVELSACAGNAKFSETPVVTYAQLAGPWVPVQRTLYAAAAGDGGLQLQGEMQGTDAASRYMQGLVHSLATMTQ